MTCPSSTIMQYILLENLQKTVTEIMARDGEHIGSWWQGRIYVRSRREYVRCLAPTVNKTDHQSTQAIL